MKGQKAVLVHCKHYDAIMNFRYPYDDYITEKLVNAYQEYLFQIDCSDEKSLLLATQLDQVMQVYIGTKSFYQYVQNYYLEDTNTVFVDIIDMVALYHDYIRKEIKSIHTTKWI